MIACARCCAAPCEVLDAAIAYHESGPAAPPEPEPVVPGPVEFNVVDSDCCAKAVPANGPAIASKTAARIGAFMKYLRKCKALRGRQYL